MTTNGHKGAYDSAANDVLAALVYDPAKVDRAQFELDITHGLFPSREHQACYEALCTLRRAGESISDITILAVTGDRITLEWLTDILNTYTPATGAAFETNCRVLRSYGLRAGASRVLAIAAAQLDKLDGKTTEQIISQTMDILGGLHTSGGIKNVTAGAVAGEFADFMQGEAVASRLTGLAWLDEYTGGFAPGDNWIIASAYKMRKTTLMINLAIHQARTGASVAFLSREMNKRQLAAQMVAMFAIGFLIEHNLYSEKTSKGNPLNWISGRSLTQARRGYLRWDHRKVAAVNYGIEQFRALENNLRIYDSSDEGGRLSDIASAESILKRDLALHGTTIVFWDYLQLFDAPGAGVYDKVSYAARKIQEIGKRDNVAQVSAAQKNEDAVKNGSHESYSVGISGGGVPSQTADFLLVTRYKYGDLQDENKLELTLQHSRHGSGGNDTKELFSIHPGSGLILESEYVYERARQHTTEPLDGFSQQSQPNGQKERIRV